MRPFRGRQPVRIRANNTTFRRGVCDLNLELSTVSRPWVPQRNFDYRGLEVSTKRHNAEVLVYGSGKNPHLHRESVSEVRNTSTNKGAIAVQECCRVLPVHKRWDEQGIHHCSCDEGRLPRQHR